MFVSSLAKFAIIFRHNTDFFKWSNLSSSLSVTWSQTKPATKTHCLDDRCKIFTACSHCLIFFWLRLRFVSAHNVQQRSWWCCCRCIVWTLPLSPVQPICCAKKKSSRKSEEKPRSVNEPYYQVTRGSSLMPYFAQRKKTEFRLNQSTLDKMPPLWTNMADLTNTLSFFRGPQSIHMHPCLSSIQSYLGNSEYDC